jgi:hypothetical protein
MGLWPTKGDEKRLGPATTFYGTVALSFVIPSGADGICSSADLSWKCFSDRAQRSGDLRFLFFGATFALPDGKRSLDEGHGFSRAEIGWSNEGFSP